MYIYKINNIVLFTNITFPLVPNRFLKVFETELSQGDFVTYSRGKCVSSTKHGHIDREVVDGGEDASGLLLCPVDRCMCTEQTFNNLECHLLFGKCKTIPEKHSLLDHEKLPCIKTCKRVSLLNLR